MRRAARLLLYVGAAAIVFGLGKVHAAQIAEPPYDYTSSFRFGWSIFYVTLLCGAAYGLGLPDLARGWRSAAGMALGSSLAASLGISTVQIVLGSAVLPRFTIFGAAVLVLPWFVGCAAVSSGGRMRQEGRGRVVLVAPAEDAAALRADLERNPERPAKLVAVIAPDLARSTNTVRPLTEAAKAAGASVLVLGRLAQLDSTTVQQAAELHEAGVRVRTLSLFYEEWLGKMPLPELERMALMFDIGELHRARYGRMKRGIDIVVALLALAVLPAVVILVLLGNLIGNRGPLFFRQVRVGRYATTFTIYKFRTMRPGDGSGSWTATDDPRVTPFGRFLRRCHLDELPQALNLLQGAISVVGPRPEQVHYVEELTKKIPFYGLRHLVRPGITGWAQVKYTYGADEADALEKLQYDFYYLRHQGLGLDARVVGRTLRSIAGRSGR
ncbi:MAG TPA: sugar transferase [Acidimicrobiales bacterium]|nr:sugar transferase [Acidimicrobiales bacterium]